LVFSMTKSLFDRKQRLLDLWVLYKRPHDWPYVRLASWLLSDHYINIWIVERQPQVLASAAEDIAREVRTLSLSCDIIMGAQMWSVRFSAFLGLSLWSLSIYAEKKDGELLLQRHDIDLVEKSIILCEDVITRATTIKKMIAIVKKAGWVVSGISCLVNRTWQDDFDWLPIVSLYAPDSFLLYYDKNTPSIAKEDYPRLPEWSSICESPKYSWTTLITSVQKKTCKISIETLH